MPGTIPDEHLVAASVVRKKRIDNHIYILLYQTKDTCCFSSYRVGKIIHRNYIVVFDPTRFIHVLLHFIISYHAKNTTERRKGTIQVLVLFDLAQNTNKTFKSTLAQPFFVTVGRWMKSHCSLRFMQSNTSLRQTRDLSGPLVLCLHVCSNRQLRKSLRVLYHYHYVFARIGQVLNRT